MQLDRRRRYERRWSILANRGQGLPRATIINFMVEYLLANWTERKRLGEGSRVTFGFVGGTNVKRGWSEKFLE